MIMSILRVLVFQRSHCDITDLNTSYDYDYDRYVASGGRVGYFDGITEKHFSLRYGFLHYEFEVTCMYRNKIEWSIVRQRILVALDDYLNSIIVSAHAVKDSS